MMSPLEALKWIAETCPQAYYSRGAEFQRDEMVRVAREVLRRAEREDTRDGWERLQDEQDAHELTWEGW